MKSKTRKNKFWNEVMRGQKWSMLVTSIAMFILYPVQLILFLNYQERYGKTREIIIEAVQSINLYWGTDFPRFTSTGYTLLYISLLVGGIAGVVAFSYLHNSTQVGLYHSLPVSRNKILATKFMTATVSYVIPLVLGNVICLLVVMTRGYLTGIFVLLGIVFFVYNMIMFWMGYLISSIAMLLTGRILVGIFGAIVLCFYCPCINLLVNAFIDISFDTTVNLTSNHWGVLEFVLRISPVFYIRWVEWNSMIAVLLSLFILVFLGGLHHFLMMIRPSEVAGKAMAYKNIGEIIKVALVVAFALGSSLLFYSVAYNSMNWLYFGAIFGVITGYIIIQLLYGVVFKELFQQKLQIFLLLTGVLIAIVIPVNDVFGYDIYMPKYEDVEDINIEFKVTSGYTTGILQSGFYEANMGKDQETYDLVEMIMESADRASEEGASWSELMEVYIQYDLENGTRVERLYSCYTDDVKDSIGYLWNNEEFLDVMYPIRIQDPTEIERISFYESYVSGSQYDDISLDAQQREAFARAYQADMLAVTDASILEELPIGSGFYYYDMNAKDGEWSSGYTMYIYPSFTNTLAYLEGIGIELPTSYVVADVDYIVVYDYADTSSTYEEGVAADVEVTEEGYVYYREEAEIEAWLKMTGNGYLTTIFTEIDEDRNVEIYWKDGSREYVNVFL